MALEITVQQNDNLYKIVKQKYGLTDDKDIKTVIDLIAKENNIKNINSIMTGQKLYLPELKLDSVTIFNSDNNTEQTLYCNKNYYRSNEIFGDIRTNPAKFPNQGVVTSTLSDSTKQTKYIENVVANVKDYFMSDTSKDAKATDIFAKQIGKWTKDGETVWGGMKFEQTEAYKFAIQNNDDFVERTTTYKGQQENHYYYDSENSDGKITLFSLEEVNGKEYFTMCDKNGEIHYFDRADNLKENYFLRYSPSHLFYG